MSEFSAEFVGELQAGGAIDLGQAGRLVPTEARRSLRGKKRKHVSARTQFGVG